MSIALLIFVAVFIIVLAVGWAVAHRQAAASRMVSVVGEPESGRRTRLRDMTSVEGLLKPLHRVVPRSEKEVSVIRKRLLRAGYRAPAHLNIFYGLKAAVPVALVCGATLTGLYQHGPLFVYGTAACLGFLSPDFVLGHLIARRQLKLRLGLADALDLLVICIEAGLGLDQAVSRVSQELRLSHPVLSDEFGLVNLEQRAGRPRAECWRNLAERTGVDTIRAIVASIIQADQFGSSVAKALRTHADTTRTQRRQRSEEQAAKTTVKLVFPLVFCIFPSLFVVALGPSMIVLLDGLNKFLLNE